MLDNRQMDKTDDRALTIYFKIKLPRPPLLHKTTQSNEIYTYRNGARELLPIARPIINHKNSITSSSCENLRILIKAIIEENPYLTKDVYKTINLLSKFGPPGTIFTGDIEAFYTNTPHELIISAFKHYHPYLREESQLLKRLLQFNYTTDCKDFYYLGEKGFPMGLPLAPELAKMCTAFLLRDYQPPPGHSLTVYLDDLAATYPIDNIPLQPYSIRD